MIHRLGFDSWDDVKKTVLGLPTAKPKTASSPTATDQPPDQILLHARPEDALGTEFYVENFLHLVRSNYVATELIRIGPDGDGGYLVPNDLRGISSCYSPGVADNFSFEMELLETYGIPSNLMDASIQKPDDLPDGMHFTQSYLGPIPCAQFVTLKDWMAQSASNHATGDNMLQMDIEGGEYGVLIQTDRDVLKKFRVILIEFHDLGRLADPIFCQMASAVFAKLLRDFVIVHIHPNNNAKTASIADHLVPEVMEFSLLRRDRVDKIKRRRNLKLPHRLDQDNNSGKKSVPLPPSWWLHERQSA